MTSYFMSDTIRNNKSQKYGNKNLKKFGNKRYRHKVKQAIKLNKNDMPIKKECSNPWDWD